MRPASILAATLLLVTLPAACGGSDPSADWATPAEAFAAAEQARARNDFEVALLGYRFAAESPAATPDERFSALLGLGEIQARAGQAADAEATFAQALGEHAELVEIRSMRRVTDAWISARDVARASAAIEAALARFPDQAEAFQNQRRAIEALESGNEDLLNQLGYVGD